MRKNFLRGIVIFLLIIMVVGPEAGFAATSKEQQQVHVEYATKFKVSYLKEGVKLVVDGADRQILLIPKGVKKPDGYPKAVVVNMPVDKVLLCSSTHPSLLRPLGNDVFDKIVAVTTYDVDKGHIDSINNRMKNGKIAFVGKNAALDYELIKAKGVKLAFIMHSDLSKNGEKLKELGIPFVVEASSFENDPLGRMEWIKLMSVFFDEEERATQHLQVARTVINGVRRKTKGANPISITAGVIYEGKFSIRYGGSYQAKMHEIAAGDYVYKDFKKEEGGSVLVSPEDFYAKSAKADVLIFEAMGQDRPQKIQEIVDQAPIIKNMKSIKNKNVWVYQKWWFQSVDKLHEIMQDEAAILHPELFSGYKVKHYYKLSE